MTIPSNDVMISMGKREPAYRTDDGEAIMPLPSTDTYISLMNNDGERIFSGMLVTGDQSGRMSEAPSQVEAEGFCSVYSEPEIDLSGRDLTIVTDWHKYEFTLEKWYDSSDRNYHTLEYDHRLPEQFHIQTDTHDHYNHTYTYNRIVHKTFEDGPCAFCRNHMEKDINSRPHIINDKKYSVIL